MPSEANLTALEQTLVDAIRCTPEDALSVVGDGAQDTQTMASALVRELNELVARHAEPCSPETAHSLAGVRDMAAELEEFLSWAAEDPIKLAIQLKCIEADLPVEF